MPSAGLCSAGIWTERLVCRRTQKHGSWYTLMPNNSLLQVLRPALNPCPHFDGACSRYCRWDPPNGHVPRGFGGGNANDLSDIKLIIVTAEPADPADDEVYSGTAHEMIAAHAEFVASVLKDPSLLRRSGRNQRYHKNLRRILDLCWPDLPLDEQLERTWLTNTVLCSAAQSGAAVHRDVERTCVRTYVGPQIALLPHAFVLALGHKAKRRLSREGIRVDAAAQHPSPRGSSTNAEASWKQAASEFQDWLRLRSSRENHAWSPVAARPQSSGEFETVETTAEDMADVLRGGSTSAQVERFAVRHPRSRIRKLGHGSCTKMMKRESFIGGKRWSVFKYLDGEPLLGDAIRYGQSQGMTVSGKRAHWDILEALKQGYIEIRSP